MKFYKKSFHVLMICLLLFTSFLPYGEENSSLLNNLAANIDNSIVDSLLEKQTAEAALYDGPDWVELNKNRHRVTLVDDSQLKPLILFKAKLKLGWSVSEGLAVGKFIYLVATVPPSQAGSRNFFQLPSGVYLYKIPVNFKFQGNLSDNELRNDLLEKGAKVLKIQEHEINHSHPIYNPQNDVFYIGVATKVYAIRGSDLYLYPYNVETGARLTSAPMVLGNDLVGMPTSTAATAGNNGDLWLIKGLTTNNPTLKRHRLSDHPTAEIATPTGINAQNEMIIPINYRDSGKEGTVARVTITDSGFGAVASLSVNWRTYTNVGVPPPVIYYGGYIYASAKYGKIYKIDASSGDVVWTSTISNVQLINNTMVSDGQYIYVPVRRPGKMVKIDMSTGSQVWSIAAGRQINGSMVDSEIDSGEDVANDPILWHTPDGRELLLYGTTAGQLIFKTVSGNRSDVVLDHQTSTIAKSSITGSNVSSGQDWETQGTGISTSLLMAKNHLVFGVNTSTNFGETLFYSVGIADDVYVKSVEGGDYQGKEDVITEVVVGSKDFSSGLRVPVVRLEVDGVLVGEKRIHLMPGEEKTVRFTWQVQDNVTDGKILATINIPPEFMETDMENNKMTADYTSGFGYNICLPNERNNTAIIKTEAFTDSEGKTYDVDFYEYLETKIRDKDPLELRAGYGFNFVTDTHYLDETSTFAGPERVKSVFPDSPNYVDNEVYKVRESVSGPQYDQEAVWHLPLIYVEYYSGNVFHETNDARLDSEDHFVLPEGEKKWYTDFYTPDGPYIFKSVAMEAGKNDLTSCYTDFVTIKGTPFDDYVRRSVIPDTPFLDDEVGYNWQGNEMLIGDLVDLYYNPNNNTGASDTYYLSNDMIKQIKDDDFQTISKSEVAYFFSSFDFE